MDKCLRKTGLGMVGDVPWGTHFCQFYSSGEDMLDILVPYFKAGLEANEFCMWVTSEPLGVDEVVSAMRSAMPDFDERMEKGQVEVIPYTAWYKRDGRFNSDEVLAGWVGKLEAALKSGYEGLRLTGNTFWLERRDWNDFKAYEEAVDAVIGSYNMIALCTYSLARCSATDIMDVLSNHSFALMRREGIWEAIESFGRRLIEKKLSESENKYKIVADNTYGWEFWIGPDGAFRYVSPSCERISGHKPDEFLADPGMRKHVIAPEDRTVFERHVHDIEKKMLSGELEFRIVQPDGRTRWIGHVCQPVYDSEGRFQGTRGSNLDITDRKLAQDKVRMNEEKYRSLFDSMMNGFGLHEIICDDNGAPRDYRFIEVNKAFEDLTGLKREDVIGKTVLEILPETEPYWIETFGKVAITGKPASIENYSKALEKFYEVVAYSPRKGQFAAIFADVSERKRMENDLRRAKEELETRVEERTAELEATLAELERSNRELEGFAYIASHDLKEPLLMVSSYIHLLVRKYRGRLGTEADRYIDSAVKGITRMEHMVNDLLEYSRVQTQTKPFENVECSGVLEQALDNLAVTIRESGAEVKSARLPLITGDSAQLSRVFQNLVGNAIKFRRPAAPPNVKIGFEEKPDGWLFSVTDNGIGIEPQDLDTIFRLFHRVHEKEYPGTGIGLAITKRIIERHGGSIWVESTPGHGSTFFFIIPKKHGAKHGLPKAA